MKFVMFKGSLEEGAAPIYLFDGEEEYFKRRGEEMLKQKYLTEPSLNYSSFDGAELKGSRLTELIAAAQSFPFLSEKRIVKVAGLYPTEKEYETYLRPYFEHPCDTTILLIVNGEGKAKGFDLKKAPNVTRVDCSRADEETVLRWIYTRMRRAGVACNTDCCERIMRYCLGSMSRIATETEKLLAYAGQGGTLTAEDVDAVVYRDTDYNIYEMTDVLGRGNYGAYLSVMNELLGKGMDEAGVLNSLCNYFRTMYEILALNKSDADTAKALGMKEYAVRMSRRQAKLLGAAKVETAYFAIFGAVNAVKSGKMTPQGALTSVNAMLFFGMKENNAC